MNARRIWKLLTSMRTAVGLILTLSVLMVLNVAVPQRQILGPAAYAEIVDSSPWKHFLLDTLGFGHISTSPIFLAVLALFYTCLVMVMAERMRSTALRIQIRPPSQSSLDHRSAKDGITLPRPQGWEGRDGARVLENLGYEMRSIGPRAWWGVKHRRAAIGFMLFHSALLLLFAGGVTLYMTRFAGGVRLVDGQSFDGRWDQVIRRPIIGGLPEMGFTATEIEPRIIDGERVHLGAQIVIRRGTHQVRRSARINAPAKSGPVSILIESAGLAPVVWIQDAEGYTVEKVAINLVGAAVTLPLAGGAVELQIKPLPPVVPLPEDLASARFELRGLTDGDGDEKPWAEAGLGDSVSLGEYRAVIEEIRYWAGYRVVSERGGGALIAGFVLAVIGLWWRLQWYRREAAVCWDEDQIIVSGRTELYRWRHREELEALAELVLGAAGGSHKNKEMEKKS